MKKVVLKLEFYDDRIKQKAMQKACGISGVESIAINMMEKKLTVIGDVDPVSIVSKLRKLCHTDIVSVGPAKEPEKKKDEPIKKDDGKKDEPTKGGGDQKQQGGGGGGGDGKKQGGGGGNNGGGGGGGGGGDNKKNDSKGDSVKAYPALPPPPAYQQHFAPPPPAYHQHYPPPMPYHYHHYPPPAPVYYVRAAEEDPNSCVIC